MWNLNEELAKWTEKLTSARLPLGTVRDIRYNPRLTSTWGQCKHITITDKQKKICDIVISQRLADAPYGAFVDTLVHELLHTCKYAKHHDGTWKEYAEKANRLFELNIKRTASTEEKA